MTCRHRFALMLAIGCPMGLLGGCVKSKLHPTFGDTYRAHFAAQVAEHNHRPLAGFSGDEARRAMQTYYSTLLSEAAQNSGSQSGASGPGGSGITMPSLSTSGGSGAQGSPFSFKVR